MQSGCTGELVPSMPPLAAEYAEEPEAEARGGAGGAAGFSSKVGGRASGPQPSLARFLGPDTS